MGRTGSQREKGNLSPKDGTASKTRHEYDESEKTNISFCRKLSGIFFKQLLAGPDLLDFGMQFIYVIGHS